MSDFSFTTLAPSLQVALAERMLKLHGWSSHAHGHYWKTAPEQQGDCIKQDIKHSCKVVWEPITTELMLKHLRGEYPLGGFSLCKDSTCKHVFLDVDNYDLNYIDMGRRIKQSKLPLVFVTTKSGGGRLGLPCKNKEPAVFARKVMAKCRTLLGLNDGKAKEIFPKQDYWKQDDPDFCGNWYALPYVGENWSEATNTAYQCARNEAGNPLSLEEYLDLYEKLQATHEELEAILARNTRRPGVGSGEVWTDGMSDEEFLAGAPPCIHNMHTSRVNEGGRNTCITHCAAFARKKYPNNIPNTLRRLNSMLMAVPLPDDEVWQLGNRAAEGKVGKGYMCKEAAVEGYCDKQSCKKVKYGPFTNGGDELDEPFEVSIDEMIGEQRTAFITINGRAFHMSARDLFFYQSIVRIAMEQDGLDVGAFDKKKFMKAVHEAWAVRGSIEPPPGFEPHSTYLGYLSHYIKIHAHYKDVPDVGSETVSPWIDTRENPPRFVFKMHNLQIFVEQKCGCFGFNKLEMGEAIKFRNGGNYSGREDYGERRKRNCWWVSLTDDEQAAVKEGIAHARRVHDYEGRVEYNTDTEIYH